MTTGVVLVIDADRAVREAFERCLADDGYAVQLAGVGQRALELAADQ
jgi:CheY-like chemotaxis protein